MDGEFVCFLVFVELYPQPSPRPSRAAAPLVDLQWTSWVLCYTFHTQVEDRK